MESSISDMEVDYDNSVSCKYFKVMDNYAVANFKAIIAPEMQNTVQKVKTALILCLDKSGSMRGQPIEAVRRGAEKIAYMFDESDIFDYFLTIAFDSYTHSYEFTSIDQYKCKNDELRSSGGTNFANVFQDINEEFGSGETEYEDFTIMFMTDGQTSSRQAIEELTKLKTSFDNIGAKYRIFCIGFSRNHDANLLGQISRAGNEMGNFVYVREDSPDFAHEIKDALGQAFELAPNSSSFRAKVYVDSENGFSVQCRLNQVKNSETEYECKLILPSEVIEDDVQVKIDFEFGTREVKFIESMDYSDKQMLSETLYFFDNFMYQQIVRAQEETVKEQLQKLYDDITKVDEKLNSVYMDAIKIKEKEKRKKVVEPLQSVKQKIVHLVSFIRKKMLGEYMNNDFIASLNQMAYEGVRGGAMQRKLDSRAMANQEKFIELKKQIEDYTSKLDMKKIKEDNAEVNDKIGYCFLTTKNVFECMEDNDCICICLDVRRSEACIADPTKLVVKSIIPYFLSADSFIEAAQFALASDKEAHGGFDKNSEAKILTGVGRESITGALPLYLFKEHFNLAKMKVPQILGLMCT